MVPWHSYSIYKKPGGMHATVGGVEHENAPKPPMDSITPKIKAAIEHNVSVLVGPRFSKAMGKESIGGNAGSNHLAVTAAVDEEGKITKFYHEDSDKVLTSPSVAFRVNVKDCFDALKKGLPEDSREANHYFDAMVPDKHHEFSQDQLLVLVHSVRMANIFLKGNRA